MFKKSKLLSQESQKLLDEAITKIEKQTGSELVLVVVPQSDSYMLWHCLLAFLGSITCTWLLYHWIYVWSFTWLLAMHCLFAVGIFYLLEWDPLQRLYVLENAAQAAVHKKTLQLFSEIGVFNTIGRNGVMILLSELEQRVVILGDKAIHEKINIEGWKAYIERIVQGIHHKNTATALLGVINDIGQVLVQHFPPTPNDKNELPNTVIGISK